MKITFSIRIDEELKEQVRKLAFEDKISPNKWIERAIKLKIRHVEIQKEG